MHNVNEFYGENKPKFNPKFYDEEINLIFEKKSLNLVKKFPFYISRNTISNKLCNQLIEQFENQEKYPVGVDGYFINKNDIGSYRTMGWSPELSKLITERLEKICPKIINEDLFPLCFDHKNRNFQFLGSTPFLRFMRYIDGGKHTPHYDAPFWNEEEKYVTLFSWVLYLNKPNGVGARFQFINDLQQLEGHPTQWDRSDWRNMSDDVLESISPEGGLLLVFPHWLCHQVEEFIGNGYRYIIRGDVAYGY